MRRTICRGGIATAAVVIMGMVMATLLPPLAAAADKYPLRPITLIVPFPAGGGVDAVARRIAHS
jgi:tripartite-type tricarboxylate transporter receptor subunit TctC